MGIEKINFILEQVGLSLMSIALGFGIMWEDWTLIIILSLCIIGCIAITQSKYELSQEK